MTVEEVQRFEELRRRAGRVRQAPEIVGRLVTYSVGDYVWAHWGQTRGILLGRVVSAQPTAFHAIDHIRDWWLVRLFQASLGSWALKPTFRRLARALAPVEVADFRKIGVIA